MTDLQKAKEKLVVGGYTCVLCKDNTMHTSLFRGVRPLVIWYEEDTSFEGFSAADKVVGKATAFLYVLLKVKSVYAKVISESAIDVLKSNNIEVQYDTLVKNIINRQGDGICPFESAVLNISEPESAYEAIRKKMKEMSITL